MIFKDRSSKVFKKGVNYKCKAEALSIIILRRALIIFRKELCMTCGLVSIVAYQEYQDRCTEEEIGFSHTRD